MGHTARGRARRLWQARSARLSRLKAAAPSLLGVGPPVSARAQAAHAQQVLCTVAPLCSARRARALQAGGVTCLHDSVLPVFLVLLLVAALLILVVTVKKLLI